uniref:G_PROTEIN_RECEP_F3_4 domain-containing protein n=1 Tax=Macrostomum lignano TaxID=282301 RepID=A0A1I8FX21_9PLAT
YDIVAQPQRPKSATHGEPQPQPQPQPQPLSFAASGRQVCQTCPNGSQPDPERRRCLELPLAWSGYSHPHTVPVAVISALGLATTGAFGLVFLSKRDTPLIKASGRETSAVLLVGIFLSYLCPYLMLLKPHLVVCALTRLAPGLCFTVCYAAILAKTNRIARIFQVSASSSKRTKFTSPISQLYIIGS